MPVRVAAEALEIHPDVTNGWSFHPRLELPHDRRGVAGWGHRDLPDGAPSFTVVRHGEHNPFREEDPRPLDLQDVLRATGVGDPKSMTTWTSSP